VTENALPPFERQDTRQHPQEGRLTRPVHSDDGRTVAALQYQVKFAVNSMIAIRLINLLELDYSVAAPWRLRKLEMYPPRRAGNRNPFDFIQFLDAALDLGGLGCLGAESLDEAHLPADFKLLPPGGGLPCLDILLPGENVAIIVAVVEDDIVGLN